MTQNRYYAVLKLVGSVGLLVAVMQGCSTKAPVMAQPHPLEQHANNMLQAYAVSPSTVASHEQLHHSLQQAMMHFKRLDDPAGQWRIAYSSAQHALAQHDPQTLAAHTAVMQRLGRRLSPATVAYTNAIMQGQVDPQGPYYQRALATAANDLERAVALTYLGRHDEALTLMDAQLTDHADSRAFVYYRYAMSAQSATAYQQALAYYQQVQDARGIADVLVRLAQLAAVNDQIADARAYAERAVSVLNASGDAVRAEQVDAWLARL
jgi:tetratricopeptide (TPR) repeat protein